MADLFKAKKDVGLADLSPLTFLSGLKSDFFKPVVGLGLKACDWLTVDAVDTLPVIGLFFKRLGELI